MNELYFEYIKQLCLLNEERDLWRISHLIKIKERREINRITCLKELDTLILFMYYNFCYPPSPSRIWKGHFIYLFIYFMCYKFCSPPSMFWKGLFSFFIYFGKMGIGRMECVSSALTHKKIFWVNESLLFDFKQNQSGSYL